MRCPRCDIEVDVYTTVVGGWCQCGAALEIVTAKRWAVDPRSQQYVERKIAHEVSGTVAAARPSRGKAG